jgi:hypothetical protein
MGQATLPVRAAAAVAVAACVASLPAQTPTASASAPKAVELASLMQARKLEAFAVKDTRDKAKTDRYAAVLLIPNTQILLISATYTRFMDLEYRLYHKEFMNAYADLNTSTFSQDKFVVEDALADGLVAVPKRNAPADAVKIGAEEITFNGDFADPRRRNPGNKVTKEVYDQRFAQADRRYAAMLDFMIGQLKKSTGVAAPPELR